MFAAEISHRRPDHFVHGLMEGQAGVLPLVPVSLLACPRLAQLLAFRGDSIDASRRVDRADGVGPRGPEGPLAASAEPLLCSYFGVARPEAGALFLVDPGLPGPSSTDEYGLRRKGSYYGIDEGSISEPSGSGHGRTAIKVRSESNRHDANLKNAGEGDIIAAIGYLDLSEEAGTAPGLNGLKSVAHLAIVSSSLINYSRMNALPFNRYAASYYGSDLDYVSRPCSEYWRLLMSHWAQREEDLPSPVQRFLSVIEANSLLSRKDLAPDSHNIAAPDCSMIHRSAALLLWVLAARKISEEERGCAEGRRLDNAGVNKDSGGAAAKVDKLAERWRVVEPAKGSGPPLLEDAFIDEALRFFVSDFLSSDESSERGAPCDWYAPADHNLAQAVDLETAVGVIPYLEGLERGGNVVYDATYFDYEGDPTAIGKATIHLKAAKRRRGCGHDGALDGSQSFVNLCKHGNRIDAITWECIARQEETANGVADHEKMAEKPNIQSISAKEERRSKAKLKRALL